MKKLVMHALSTIGLSIATLAVILLSAVANAFPDTARHGYVNCSTCHVSPSGGGLLNNYGRSLSRELMSTWGYKDEELPLHGIISIPDKFIQNFAIGGDSRYISRRQRTPTRNTDEGFLMQAQLRAALLFEKFKFVAAIGRIENPRKSQKVVLDTPEYYGLWTPKEEVHLRLGRFQPTYGLRLPDHGLWIRSETSFGPWIERDTAEVLIEGESTTVSLSGFQSTAATDITRQATGYTGSIYQTIGEKNRFGLSAMTSEGQGIRTKLLSAHAIVPFSEKFYGLTEFTRISELDSLHDVGFARLGYEIFKGFTPIIQGQIKNDRVTSSRNESKTGGGLIWLPRPHIEFMVVFENLKSAKGNSSENYLLFHYYL